MTKAGSKKLNDRQLKAVRHKKGPLLIIAGAGTGKTTVITERIRYLIEKGRAKPSEILALTFTEKAAREMQERVDIAMPYGYTQMWISTFHSFCDRVLRDEALHVGLDPKFKLMTQSESIQFIRNNLFKFDLDYFRPLGNPTKFVSGMLKHFSRLQDEDISPSEYLSWARLDKKKANTGEGKIESKKWLELTSAFRVYSELKVKEGVMDFGDLIVNTLHLFRERKNVLKAYKNKFKYVLVDEFQDTNYAQNQLAILLAGQGKLANITVTGDDDQSIYRFRGAAVSNIIQFRKTYSSAKIIVLTKNYRSTQEILDKSYNLITNNNPDRLEVVEKINKKLVSERKQDGDNIVFVHKDRVENEAEEVAKEIEKIVKKNKFDYKDVAILVRANNHSEPFIRSLQRKAIPYQFLGPGRLFKQPEIIDLVSYLRVLNNFEDSVALFRLLSIDFFNINSKDISRIGNYARRFNLSLFEACEKIDDVFVSPETKEKIKKTIAIIEKHLSLVRKETAGQLLYYFLESTGLMKKLLSPDSTQADKKALNISKFFDKLKTYEVDHEDATVGAVVDWIELSSELGESPLAADIDWTDINAVNILTVHSSKGLEFPVVFLVNLVSQRFPTIQRRDQIPIPDKIIKEILPEGDFHEQEERRLFYVGMTRAKDRLYFTAANYYGEGKREKRLSPFIFETLGNDALASEKMPDSGSQLSFLDYRISEKSKINEKRLTTHVDYLSYSQIETFKTCPLHYKLKYILKIPTPPSAAQSFGISIHSCLKDFYLLINRGERASEKLIIKTLENNWEREGYASKAHEKKMFGRGRKYLTEFLKVGFNPKTTTLAMEQPFVVPLVETKGEGKVLKIGGKIDRVDDLGNGKIEIIDYKTGANIPTQKQIDHDLQLTFYALAASKIREEPFNKNPKNLVLSLYYFDNQEKISTIRTQSQLNDAKKEIFKWKEIIEKSDFKCSGGYLCKNCEYKFICDSV